MDIDDIAKIIVQSDEDLDTKLAGSAMTATNKKRCSSLMTAIVIADSLPQSLTVGNTRMDFGAGRVKRWQAKVDELIEGASGGETAIVKVSSYQRIDEDSRYVR